MYLEVGCWHVICSLPKPTIAHLIKIIKGAKDSLSHGCHSASSCLELQMMYADKEQTGKHVANRISALSERLCHHRRYDANCTRRVRLCQHVATPGHPLSDLPKLALKLFAAAQLPSLIVTARISPAGAKGASAEKVKQEPTPRTLRSGRQIKEAAKTGRTSGREDTSLPLSDYL